MSDYRDRYSHRESDRYGRRDDYRHDRRREYDRENGRDRYRDRYSSNHERDRDGDRKRDRPSHHEIEGKSDREYHDHRSHDERDTNSRLRTSPERKNRSVSPVKRREVAPTPETKSPVPGSTNPVTSTTELTEKKQEKLRARQEKLRLWQLKKESEAAEKRRSESPSDDIKGSTTPNEKGTENGSVPGSRRENNQVKQENKPKQLQTSQTAFKTTDNTKANLKLGFGPNNGPKKAAIKTVMTARRAFMDDGDDDEETLTHRRRPPPKLLPMTDESIKEHESKINGNDMDIDEIDPLDAYMSEMREQVKSAETTAAPLPASVADEQEEAMDSINESAADEGGLEDYNPDDPQAFMRMIENKKKKDVIQVDHSKINYEPFRKNFYVEPQELADMTPADVDMLRLELDGIKTAGVDVPKPGVKWEHFGLPQSTMQVIRSLGYDKPTSIQAQAIPAIMSGRDVIGVAKTGSGKTMAFLLPLFRHIKDQRPLANMEGPMSIIMTPTRELALQIFKECKPFLKALDLTGMCAYGGSPIKEQIAELKRGVEIIVCTPGRMIDLLAANSGRVTNLRRVTYLVLDEADRMFDMGFEPQVMKILRNIRPDRQTVLFSATFPRQMEALAKKTLDKPVEIIVGARSVVAPEITQIVEVRPDNEKFLRLLELLGEFYYENEDKDARALIFVDRQEAADDLLKGLIGRGYPCMSIHGGKDQVDRDSAISDFKRGVVSLLIATSVAARGLDVKQLKLVINYDAPNHMEDYVHRVGRTGRAGNTGTAVTFITPDQERSAMDIAKALRLSKTPVPDAVRELADKFQAKIKSGKQKFTNTGFGGRGLDKLDVIRDSKKNKERKVFGDEDDAGEKEDNDVDADTDTAEITASSTPKPKSGPLTSQDLLDSKVVITAGTEPSSSTLKNKIVAGQSADNLGPDSGKFHTTLEINDLPQKARWAVTSNSTTTRLVDLYGCSFTVKGEYYPPGQKPGDQGARKLYILIEGDSEDSVAKSHKALVALAKTAIEAEETEKRAAGGRYSI
ncbi:DEAD-box RNA helicase PRP5 [Sugiyamaella lignohabitans]|uniref:RNA helicase n=1 Tax=Sugiyamaella lignohabitans TaxID=796027 RepID=A0A161HJV5_9ASCO|nr:DEAD-box RNA helicase PRP5 [Sugiyamaella lignohabitans]ANB13087.1 DEAD-box RNA helicase PRP5 [Sugiyamaella lignohabitans]